MRSPIKSFDKIKEDFIRYYDTAYHIDNKTVEKERDALLNTDGNLTREPYIEPMPEYKSFANAQGEYVTFGQLSREDLELTDQDITDSQWRLFKGLAGIGLFNPQYPLYSHQAEMLKQALKGKNCVVTSGTGSGKTESFLLPLFAQLCKEMQSWLPINGSYPDCNLVKQIEANGHIRADGALRATGVQYIANNDGNLNFSSMQRPQQVENRQAAVRALLIYPMNALVEDQIRRLRVALDNHVLDIQAQSEDNVSLNWFNHNADGNRLYFGRYNSSAPVSGSLRYEKASNAPKVQKFYQQLKAIDSNYDKVVNYLVHDLPKDPEFQNLSSDEKQEMIQDHLNFFPRLDGTEMYSRQDMQTTPPDILITNFSMLSIMMMRRIEDDIWTKTKLWLDANPNNVFHIIVDELHLNRGTAGTEQAYLLRMLYKRLGRTPRTSKQIRILASSASLEGNDEGCQFVADFFDLDINDVKDPNNFMFIPGYAKPVKDYEKDDYLPSTPFIHISEAWEKYSIKGSDKLLPDFLNACKGVCQELGIVVNSDEDPLDKLLSGCLSLHINERLHKAFSFIDSEGRSYQRAIVAFGEPNESNMNRVLSYSLFGPLSIDNQRRAIDGLFIIRSIMADDAYKKKYNDSLPRFRTHMFFKNVRGFWVSLDKDEVDDKFKDKNRTIGRFYSHAVDKTVQGNRTLELLYCEHCGTILVGGYRAKAEQDMLGRTRWGLLPYSPDLEKVPNSQISDDVLQRTYLQFGVFWPGKRENMTLHSDIRTGEIASDYSWSGVQKTNGNEDENVQGEWKTAYLNKKSGTVFFDKPSNMGDFVEGQIYRIVTKDKNGRETDIADTNRQQDYMAMPHTCPSCGTNLQPYFNNGNLRGRRSPIRGFHAGLSKSSQLLADEMMKQLPAEASKHKLVAFSDSREGAARLSASIEYNHFSEMVREILAKEYRKTFETIYKNQCILYELEKGQRTPDDYNGEDKDFAYLIDDALSYIRRNQNTRLVANTGLTAEQYLNSVRKATVPAVKLDDFIANSAVLTDYMKEFIKLGVNPSGSLSSYQTICLGNDTIRWERLFDFVHYAWSDDYTTNWRVLINNNVFKEFAMSLSGRLFYSFESTGLGYFCVNHHDTRLLRWLSTNNQCAASTDELLNVVDACIRVWLELFKHNMSINAQSCHNRPIATNYTESIDRWPQKVRRWLENVATHHHWDVNGLKETIFNIFTNHDAGLTLLHSQWGVILEKLYFQFVSKDSQVYWNPTTKIPHLILGGGICVNEGRNRQYADSSEHMVLVPAVKPDGTPIIVKDLWHTNYLSYYSMEEQLEPVRMHCEEMTGQTDDQFPRQRHFRNIVLGDENKLVDQIDLLSVTTTLEVGVDIGSLQSVLLADMPPQRFNYQQRVGRAGRRGQAFSFVLTFCRDRSHDSYYFENPVKITGDPCPTPFLSMRSGNYNIAKRLIAKEILRVFFRTISNLDDSSDINGEFGLLIRPAIIDGQGNVVTPAVNNWFDNNPNSYRNQFIIWLKAEKARGSQSECLETVKWIIGKDNIRELNDWVTINNNDKCGLLERIDDVLKNELISSVSISTKLAEGGLLPMYGMPSDQKNLLTSNEAINNLFSLDSQQDTISRDAETAIYEFAPNSQKTKDKQVHTAVGFAPTFGTIKPFDAKYVYECCKCHHIMVDTDKSNIEGNQCDYCGEPVDPFIIKRVVLPYNYITNRHPEDSVDEMPVFVQKSPSITENAKDTDEKQVLFNANLTFANQSFTWKINDNNGNGFVGHYRQWGHSNPFFLWELDNNSTPNGGMVIPTTLPVEVNNVCIASCKSTNVLHIGFRKLNKSLNIDAFAEDPINHQGKGIAVRAAFYSSAFIIQRSLAELLDVNPEEVEISSIQECDVQKGDDTVKAAEIIFNDQLINGSGFVRHLYDKDLKRILAPLSEEENPVGYKTAEPMSDDYNIDFIKSLFKDEHIRDCNDSCYKCLKVYMNMSYHPILDWRLGISMLRMMSNSDYTCGADGIFSGYPELTFYINGIRGTWLDYCKMLADEFKTNYLPKYTILNTQPNNEGLWYLSDGKKKIIIVHPLWELDNPIGWLANNIARVGNISDITFVDTFNLQRRQPWCFMHRN